MTDAGINPSSTITTTTTAAAAMTTIVPNDNTSTVASVNSTAANVPTGEPRKGIRIAISYCVLYIYTYTSMQLPFRT